MNPKLYTKEKVRDVSEPKAKKRSSKKMKKVMHEFKEGELHSGSRKGPKVRNRKQALAIALHSEK